MSEKINIEIVYALPTQQYQLKMEVDLGTSALSALLQSGFIKQHHLNLEKLQCGIFGRLIDWSDALTDQDRLEIYRPLLMDPKEMRAHKVTRKLPRRCS